MQKIYYFTYSSLYQSIKVGGLHSGLYNGKNLLLGLMTALFDIFKMYTKCGIPRVYGKHKRPIEVNKVADFQVLGKDTFKANKEEIGNISCCYDKN